MPVPPWLEQLLNAAFFSVCRIHADAAKSECNMYCLDCNDKAFCFYCRSSKHKDHQVIQIRRSSYHDVVRVSEIQQVLDITGVQTYVINSARVLFLNERPQPKTTGKGVSHICEICGRNLLDPFRFCSLGCKIRRSSYHDVVRVSEIQQVLDITGVQTYVINSARVLFLNERPQPKTTGKGVSHICEICGRNLLDPFRFCSLGCKLVGIKRSGNASFTLEARNEEQEMERRGVVSTSRERGIISSSSSSREEEELREGSQQDIYPSTPPPPPSSARRRKGIPHRAPFGS